MKNTEKFSEIWWRVFQLIRREGEASKRLFLYDALAFELAQVADSGRSGSCGDLPGPCDTPEARLLLGGRCAQQWGVVFALLKRLCRLCHEAE